MSGYRTPPHYGPTTPPRTSGKSTIDDFQLATPTSMKWESPKPNSPNSDAHFAALHTQKDIDANPALKRLQQDLLILTSFNDNTSLHWRPAWFNNERTPGTIWTLHNPPNVVTELLSNDCKGIQLYTRRMRRRSDPPPQYIKDRYHWVRYCDMYGIPHDFLSQEQVRLMRMGLPRDADGYPRSRCCERPLISRQLTHLSATAVPAVSRAFTSKPLHTRTIRVQHSSASQISATYL
jgi:hypothetical protein